MALRSFNSFAWLGIALTGTWAMIAPSVGCDTSFVPPSPSGTGGTSGATTATTDGSSSGSNSSSSGSGSGGSSVGSSSGGSSAGGSSSGGSSSSDSSAGGSSSGGSSAGGSSSGGSSAGGSSGVDSGTPGGGTPPTTVFCPPGKNLAYYLNFTDPNWKSSVSWTFGVGEGKPYKNNGSTDANVSVVQDPAKGQALKVLYRTGSGPNSCWTCIPDLNVAPSCTCATSGGAEFYADFAHGKILEYAFLSYWVRFGDPGAPFDWGRAGKMPGLSGGIPVHGLNIVNGSGFTAREMWRPNVCAGKTAELYWYGLPVGSSNTDQCGTGPAWNWQNDAKWHQVQMQLKMSTGANYDGSIQFWYDKPITSAPDIDVQKLGMLDRTKFPMNSVSQFMFSTFFGGHDNTWGPMTDVYAYFADIQVCD
jgi:hypothetical protein